MFPVSFSYLPHFSSLVLTVLSVVYLVGCCLVSLLGLQSILGMKTFAYRSVLGQLLVGLVIEMKRSICQNMLRVRSLYVRRLIVVLGLEWPFLKVVRFIYDAQSVFT